MNPVKTAGSNFVYRGPTVDIGDIWVERAVISDGGGPRRVVYVDWQPTTEERKAIADGTGVVRLGILGMEPIPPVSLEVWHGLEVVSTEPPPIEEPGA